MSDEIREGLEDRYATYGLLARLLIAELDEGQIEDLARIGISSETGCAQWDEGARLVGGYLAKRGDQTKTELAVDFTNLFVVRTANTYDAAYPFESVYTSEKHVVMDGARDDVVRLYREAGMGRADGWTLGEDHVSLELEYVQVLCKKCLDAIEAGEDGLVSKLIRDQSSFLDEHLLSWVPQFAQAMRSHARTDFYRGVADMLEGYLSTDRQYLIELLA